MKWTWPAMALFVAAVGWAQGTEAARDPSGAGPGDPPGENIALGAGYTLDPGPNCGLC